MKIAKALQMRKLDRNAIENFAIPGMILMENAGRGTVDFMLNRFGPVSGKSALIFIGPGNNGGDGLVIARHIHQLGGFPYLFYLTPPEALKGDAGRNQQIVAKLDLPFFIVNDSTNLDDLIATIREIDSRATVWTIVDALFGTGLTRELTGRFRDTVNLINTMSRELSCPVTAVDMPSGLQSDSGAVLGDCTRATITATYGLAKPAHYLHGGPRVGELKVVDIGIPPQVIKAAGLQGQTLGPDLLNHSRERHPAAHKGGFGHLLILAGSSGKTGAAILSALGALRCGTGLVSLAVPHELNSVFEVALTEAMTIPLPSSRLYLSIDDYELIAEHCKRKKALVLGPGIGTEAVTRDLVLKLYREQPLPMVVDADALNILALKPDILAQAAGPRILTPHPGEMARLLGATNADIQADRLSATARLAELTKGADVTIVLKGAGTICRAADDSWAINTSGNPGMAAGGMGDVLSGLTGGLLAQGYTPRDAAELGVYVHGVAADLLARKNNFGYTASEVAASLPYAFNINSLEDK